MPRLDNSLASNSIYVIFSNFDQDKLNYTHIYNIIVRKYNIPSSTSALITGFTILIKSQIGMLHLTMPFVKTFTLVPAGTSSSSTRARLGGGSAPAVSLSPQLMMGIGSGTGMFKS